MGSVTDWIAPQIAAKRQAVDLPVFTSSLLLKIVFLHQFYCVLRANEKEHPSVEMPGCSSLDFSDSGHQFMTGR
jgi:hypothetical protein